jgi:hypothetical protein
MCQIFDVIELKFNGMNQMGLRVSKHPLVHSAGLLGASENGEIK